MRILSLMLWVVLASCTKVSSAENELYYEGEIDEKAYEIIVNEIRENNIKKLIIKSYGGSEDAGLKIANVINDNNIEVEVKDVCASACSQYLLVASNNVTIQKNSLVAFHGSSFATSRLFKVANTYSISNEEAIRLSDETIKLYEASLVDISILMDSIVSIEPECINSINLPEFAEYKYNFWIPTKSYLGKANFKFTGYWPPDKNSADELVKKFFKPGVSWFYGYNKEAFDNIDVILNSYRTACSE